MANGNEGSTPALGDSGSRAFLGQQIEIGVVDQMQVHHHEPFAELLDLQSVPMEKSRHFSSAKRLQLRGSFRKLCENVAQFNHERKFSAPWSLCAVGIRNEVHLLIVASAGQGCLS